ncbi:sodium:proton antiporter NhaD [uncultured Odoribacter sp.]|uniref:sodium:proton antiporter NhaD n=1 Tax=uncultured Odoribacter sp. TaxID=876416 RepID=UPI00260F5A89|nr:sodium:proton antiporter NhaD [uncultured Odoribacter sp.]
MVTIMIVIFILGYVFIALENKTGINKAAVALILGMLLWTLFIFSGAGTVIQANSASFSEFLAAHKEYLSLSKPEQVIKYIVNLQIIDHLGDVSEILFYLLGAMTIVELIDVHKGFEGITGQITTRNKKKLLWLIGFITFFMSSVLDNMTSAIVMIMLLQKLLDNPQERWIFGSIVIIAANAGGAWTPIGDVTTIMLWINDNITSGNIMRSLFFPSIAALALPLWIVSLQLKGNIASVSGAAKEENGSPIIRKERNTIFILGILCLLFVPVFKSLTHLPPFAGILLTLGLLWIYMDIFYNRRKNIPADRQFRLPEVLSKIDFSTILFFFGILMAVAALEAIGILDDLSVFLDRKVHNVYIVSIIIGFLSSVIDNVPLVAASMGMYPVLSPQAAAAMPEAAYMSNFVQDGTFWELIAYCAGTGGSILIIGSAAGVVVMGLEKINFMWYVKHISWLAIAGFLAGIGIYILQKSL